MDNALQLIQVIGDILRHEMNLKEDQTVLKDQAFGIPPDERLYISVGLMGGHTFAVKNRWVNNPVDNTLRQDQSVNRRELLSIVLYSKSTAALERNWEIPLALNSTYAQQVQEAQSFNIAKVPLSMGDISDQEGAARLYRYSYTWAILTAYQKTTDIEYFDSFATPEVVSNQ